MPIPTTGTLPLATASSAPLWIAGWIIILALIIGLPLYFNRRRRRPDRPPR